MSMYIIFFGKSQDFTTCYYDRDKPIHDFNSVIKDFDLLESRIFTVDDIKNKEILSRYYFTTQSKDYCLLKLYSFAQAYSGNRIAGSIYGVGLLSDNAIIFSENNLELLRAAKNNFAKLALDGVKFNKSNFRTDTDRIWKAIVSKEDGNLLDNITTSPLSINGSDGPVSFFVTNLFSDAIKLNHRISNQITVYLSEDLEHLKRTQNKWGKESFPIYWEQSDKFIPYKEPIVEQKKQPVPVELPANDLAKLRAELSDSKYINRNLQSDLDKLKDKHKLFTYIMYGLLGLLLFLLLFIIFFSGDSKKEDVSQSPPSSENLAHKQEKRAEPVNVSLTKEESLDTGIIYIEHGKFVYSIDIQKSFVKSSDLDKKFIKIQDSVQSKTILNDNITQIYIRKSHESINSDSAKTDQNNSDQEYKKYKTPKKENKKGK